MAETTAYDIPIDQLNTNGQKLLAYAQEHPVQCGLISCIVVAGVATIVVPLVMSAATNPATARVVVAAVNSQARSHPNTPLATASPFLTTLQAMTTTGTLITHSGALISAGTLAADWAKGVDWAKGIDWAKGADWAGWAQAAGRGGEDLARGVAGLGKEADRAAGGAVWAAGEAVKGADWAAGEAVRRVGRVGKLLSRW